MRASAKKLETGQRAELCYALTKLSRAIPALLLALNSNPSQSLLARRNLPQTDSVFRVFHEFLQFSHILPVFRGFPPRKTVLFSAILREFARFCACGRDLTRFDAI